MEKFILNLQFIFKPAYWITVCKYNKFVDDQMNLLMDQYEFSDITEYTARLGSVLIWIANRPYNCMMPYSLIYECRPSRLTMKRGCDKLKRESVNKFDIKKIREKEIKQAFNLN